MNIEKSKQAFQRATKSIPGGVNSPARAFRSVGGNPPFISSANGSRAFDIDGNEYIDYVGSWGPMILGHAHNQVVDAITRTARNGTSFGAPTELESQMAECIKEMVPSVEKVRMVNSGTEAAMSAVRLARGFTNRDYILKFEGCYHGHGDSFLIKAGSGALTLGNPSSPGVPKSVAENTLVASFNNLDSVASQFEQHGHNIAAVVLEPVTGNMGVVLPNSGFLEGIAELCSRHNTLLIFDEVMTGFRLARGGAQELFNITPDISIFGKIIGGGLPVGAFGGRSDVMAALAPEGPVYQAGTLSGNPLAMAAGYATLSVINQTPDMYKNLEQKGAALEAGILNNLQQLNFPAVINRFGSMFTLFFTEDSNIATYEDVTSCSTEKFGQYFRSMLDNGIYLPPSQFEAVFISAAHTEEDIDKTIKANYKSLKELQDA
jgi:glutamate-1-semialdehyde 2,1-aminomutase